MSEHILLYQSILFYVQKQNTHPQTLAKTRVETLGTFTSHSEAKKSAFQAFTRNQHTSIGFGVMVILERF